MLLTGREPAKAILFRRQIFKAKSSIGGAAHAFSRNSSLSIANGRCQPAGAAAAEAGAANSSAHSTVGGTGQAFAEQVWLPEGKARPKPEIAANRGSTVDRKSVV